MKSKKPLYILAGITLGAQGLAMLIMTIIIVLQETVKNIMATPGDLRGIFVFPWSSFIPAAVLLCVAIILLVFVVKLRGKALRIAAIVLAATTLANRIANISMPLIETRLAAVKGSLFVASYSSITSAINIFTGVFSTIATVGFFFTCGMCVFFGDDK